MTSTDAPNSQRVRQSLWAVKAYRWYVMSTTSETVSDSAVKTVVPLLAVALLGADSLEVGVLNALAMTAFLVLGTHVGALVDRSNPARVMAAASFVRFLTAAGLVIAVAFGALRFWQLLILMGLVGLCDVFYTTASTTVIPRVLADQTITRGLARQLAFDTGAGAVTPAGIGLLMKVGGFALASFIAPVFYLLSAFTALRMRLSGAVLSPPDVQERGAGGASGGVVDGLRFTWSNGVIRAMMTSNALINAASAIAASGLVVYAVDVMHVPAAAVALVASVAAIGALLGSVIGSRVVDLVGIGRVRIWSCLVTVPLIVALPVSGSVWVLFVVEFAWSLLVALNVIAGTGVISRITPDYMLGRVGANVRVVTLGVMPVAGIAGGAVGVVWGVESTLLIWAFVSGTAALPIAFSPVRRWRDVPASMLARSE